MPHHYTKQIKYEYRKSVSSKNQDFKFQRDFDDIDDEYNPYKYGFRPLIEKNVYESYEIIQPNQEKQTDTKIINQASNVSNEFSLPKTEKQKNKPKTKIINIMLEDEQNIAKKTPINYNRQNQPDHQNATITYGTGKRKSKRNICPGYLDRGRNEPIPTTFYSYKCSEYELEDTK